MSYVTYLATIAVIIPLAVAVAGGTAFILSKTSTKKQLIIISSVTAGVVVLFVLGGIFIAFFPFPQGSHLNTSPTPTTTLTPSQQRATAIAAVPTNPGPPIPTVTPTSTTQNSPTMLTFDFENGTQNWDTSEGAFKLATVSTTTNPVHSGRQALEVDTALLGGANPNYTSAKEVYRHTEATVYFDQLPDTPGPFNLAGKPVSCFVYLPAPLTNQVYIRIFVKDISNHNDFGDALNIDQSNVNQWIRLSFVVGANPDNEDKSFDVTRINALGIRVDTLGSSTLNYSGPFYIDDCSVG